MRRILTANFAQHRGMLGELFDIPAFLGMRNRDAAVADLDMVDAVILENSNIIFKLIPDQKGFEKRAAKIYRQGKRFIYLDLLPKFGGLQKKSQNQA